MRQNFSSYTHLVGTCAMGDTAHSVVDDQLRVHGIDGLRIADASVIPMVPSTNTAATVYALAERAAEMVRETSERPPVVERTVHAPLRSL